MFDILTNDLLYESSLARWKYFNNYSDSKISGLETIWPRGDKTFFMLSSVEHEILNAYKFKDIKKFGFF